MINVNYGILFVWGEERINLLDGVLSILPAGKGIATVEYRQRGITFYGGKDASYTAFKENTESSASL